MIIDPWGQVIAQLEEDPGVAVAEIDSDRVTDVRTKMPLNR